MISPGLRFRHAAGACCLLALLCPLRVGAQAGIHPMSSTVVAAYAVGDTYYHAWLNGQVDMPPPIRSFPSGTTTVAYFVSFRDAVPPSAGPEARLYNARGALLQKLDPLFGIVCKQHACMDSFAMKPAFPDGSYRIDVRLNGAAVASIGFTVGRPVPAAPSGYQVQAFYTTTSAEMDAAFKANRDPARKATFPPGTTSLVYYVSVKGRVAQTRYQVMLSIPGQGVIYTSKAASLLADNVRVGASEVATATTSDTLTLHPAFPAGISRLDLLLDGKKAATTTFTVSGS